jgi:hypothetical protein
MVFTLLLLVKILTIIRIFTKISFNLLSKIPAKYTNAECIGQFNLFYCYLLQLADFFFRGYLDNQTTFLNHIKLTVMANKRNVKSMTSEGFLPWLPIWPWF